jgi:hypothetical protein
VGKLAANDGDDVVGPVDEVEPRESQDREAIIDERVLATSVTLKDVGAGVEATAVDFDDDATSPQQHVHDGMSPVGERQRGVGDEWDPSTAEKAV